MHADSWQESTPETDLSAERLALFKRDHDDCRADGCEVLDLLAEVERLRELVATCSCGTTYATYEGPEPDCPVHGAVRAFNEAQATLAAVRAYATDVAKGPYPPAAVAIKVLELLDGEA